MIEVATDLLTYLWFLGSQWVAVMSGIASLSISLWLRFTHRADIAHTSFMGIAVLCFFLATFLVWQNAYHKGERAVVHLGKPEGTLMKWHVLRPGEKGIVEIYFQNTGNTEAREFLMNCEVYIGEPGGWSLTVHIRPKPVAQKARSARATTIKSVDVFDLGHSAVIIPGHSKHTKRVVARMGMNLEPYLSEDDISPPDRFLTHFKIDS